MNLKKLFPGPMLLLLALVMVASSCKKDDTDDPAGEETDVSALIAQFDGNVTAYLDGTTIVVESQGIPNHGSPYFETTHAQYEAYNGTANFIQNPSIIAEQTLVFRIPAEAAEASNKESTGFGAIGVARNGIPFYNQYAAGGAAVTEEFISFDQYLGHPQQTGQYHYHLEPVYLTQVYGREAFLGLLLDGFPVYGPDEDGTTITNSDLDDYHGHFGATADFPDGIYHYHVTELDPYLNGDGYFGTPGTVTE